MIRLKDWFGDCWKNLKQARQLCWHACVKVSFMWVAIAVAFCGLWLLLFVTEWCGGKTTEELPVDRQVLSALGLIDPAGEGVQYQLRRSVLWRNTIAADWRKAGCLAGDTLYVTAISFTTVGFGDVVPTTPLGRVWAVLDAVLGFIAFGLLVAVLTKGLIRHMA